MAEFPALPLFTDAYLGDTTHLSTFEHGAYLLLLMVSWRSPGGCLPDDDALLSRFTRMTRDKWRKTRPILEPFFTIRGGFWHQARLQDELQHLRSQRTIRSEAGKAGNAAKSLKRANRTLANGDALRTQTLSKPDAPTPTPTPSSEDKSSAGRPAANGKSDPVKELFEIGVTLLTEAGTAEPRARSLIGKWRKAKSDFEVMTALLECRGKAISDPVEWLERRFKCAKYVSASGFEYRGDVDAVIREAEKRSDWNTYWQAKADRDGRPGDGAQPETAGAAP